MKSKTTKIIIAAAIIVVAVVLAVVGIFVLPQSLVMQITAGGETPTTLPKLLGLAIPFAVCVFSAVMYCKNENKKSLIVGGVGVLIFILTFVLNLI